MERPALPSRLLLAALAAKLASTRASAASFKELNVSTPYGYMMVRQYGEDNAARVALAFHGGVLRSEILTEWDHVARRLVESAQYKVLVPSFYSNVRLEPSRLHSEAGAKLVEGFMEKLANTRPFDLLLGKSWGGMMAAKIAASNPEYLSRLVLVAPGGLSDLSTPIGSQTLLFWAKDDKVTPISGARHVRQLLQKEVAFYAPPSGGHTIRHLFADAIVPFATDAEVLPDLGGWRVPKDRPGSHDPGAHPEDHAEAPTDDGEGVRKLVRYAMVALVLLMACACLAFCVFSLVDFWEDKGKYMVKHMEPPRPTVIGADGEEEVDLPWDSKPWE